MRSTILYAYPPESDGLSLQGHQLYLGMKKNGEETIPVHLAGEFQKEWVYKHFKPDVAVGIGFWAHTPDIIYHPQNNNIVPVPWFVADGWIANYQKDIGSLPLVLTTSEWVTKTYKRDGVDTKNFKTVPVGINTDLFRPIPRDNEKVKAVRDLLGIKEDDVVLMTIGGDVTSKGAQEVLKALDKIKGEFNNWKYICKVWGGGSIDDHYDDEMALIEKLGEENKDKVIYLEGPFSQDFMPYFLNAADIYLAPSRLEGFGMIQIEAQSCGLPVISIDEMGPKETIIHGETGFLAKVAGTVQLTEEWIHPFMGFEEKRKVYFDTPKIFAYRADVGDIVRYLSLLLGDVLLRKEMGRRAREHAVANFDYMKVAKKITDLIKERIGF